MDWLNNVFYFIQHNKILYIVIVSIIVGIVNTILMFLQKKTDRTYETNKSKKRHIIISLILCILAAAISLLISIYYSYEESISVNSPDGYIKLSFFDGKFAYHNYAGQNVYNSNDIIQISDRSFFDDPVSPIVYITIIDDSNKEVYDSKSEHMDSCLIALNYGTYTLIASCDNYQKYTATITLSPENKIANVWEHKIFFIPDDHLATDVQIQVVSQEGTPFSNCEISIGYPGYTLTDTTDDNGTINELFILAKGEYLVYIDSFNVSGRFFINELTEDKSIITVALK